MTYEISQSHGFSLPTESMDGQKPWVITEYGLPELWVKTELTVVVKGAEQCFIRGFTRDGLVHIGDQLEQTVGSAIFMLW